MKNYFKVPGTDKAEGFFVFDDENPKEVEDALGMIAKLNLYNRPIPAWTSFPGMPVGVFHLKGDYSNY